MAKFRRKSYLLLLLLAMLVVQMSVIIHQELCSYSLEALKSSEKEPHDVQQMSVVNEAQVLSNAAEVRQKRGAMPDEGQEAEAATRRDNRVRRNPMNTTKGLGANGVAWRIESQKPAGLPARPLNIRTAETDHEAAGDLPRGALHVPMRSAARLTPKVSRPGGPIADSKRLMLVADTCRLHGADIAGDAEKIYVYEAQKVAYCSTHKIASTFWLRVFRWLYNDTGTGHVASPLDISKFDTHILPLKKLKRRDIIHISTDREMVKESYRFMFTREPFARLWSVYIDKFLLPDNYFWGHYSPKIKASLYGQNVVKQANDKAQGRQKENIRSPDTDFLGGIPKRPKKMLNQKDRRANLTTTQQSNDGFDLRLLLNQSDLASLIIMQALGVMAGSNVKPLIKETKCLSYNVTFQEFLQYIVNVAHSDTGRALDDHFRPIHYGCNPCKFQPHFIGKMESMKDDSEKMLRQMNLTNILHVLSSSRHVEQEIDMLIDFNFKLVVTRRLQRACITNKELERRLIKAFIYNGYIAEDSLEVLESKLPLGRAKLKDTVMNLYKNSKRTSADIKRERTKFKIDAYKTIPVDLLYSLQKVFHWDFELFGYDPFPSELFDR